MSKKEKFKPDRFLIFCIVLSIVVAIVATVYENDRKQTEPETIPETETVSVPASDPEPESETEPVLEPEPDPESESGQVTVVYDTGTKYPHPMYIYSGWDRCLEQLHVDCDVAFLGDSITYKSSFDQEFPAYTICNLGVSGDTIRGIKDRVGTLETVKPEKVFFLIGINSLNNDNIDECIEKYSALVENVRSRGNFDLFLISVLPISADISAGMNLSPDTIVSFNETIAELANKNNATYLDLYSQLKDDSGYIRPEYTEDGLHLSEQAYKIWADNIRPYIEGN